MTFGHSFTLKTTYGATQVPTSNPTLADTYSLKGFVSIGAFADNTRYEIAPLGELSLLSATYSKDRQILVTTSEGESPTSLELAVFSSRYADTGVADIPVPYQTLLTDIIRWCHTQATTGVFTNDPEVCRQALMAEYDGKISDAVVGPMETQDTIWLPKNLTFYILPAGLGASFTTEELAALDRSRVKLWFADSAFRVEYDEFDLEFLAPLDADRLDDFFLSADQVKDKVALRTLEQTHILIEALKNGHPETKIRTLNFQYHDPLDTHWLLDTNWTFVIYGIAGDNIDSMKDLLSKWILANSTHTREEWAVLFPDIFTSTEFILTPLWSQLAIPNETNLEGVYSPTVNVQKALSVARQTCTGTSYTPAHIDSVVSSFGCLYSSLAVLVVGGPENRNGVDRFEEVWPDYIAALTSSLDFNRMQPKTQQWVAMLYAMLKVAESMTEFSDLPQAPYPMTRLKRTNADDQTFMYVVANFDNVQYLVVSRQSINQYFPPTTVDALQITSEGAIGLTALPNADIDAGTYTTTFVGVGGTMPYTYALDSVSDTARLSGAVVDPDTGVLTGTPAAAGDIQVTGRVTDANGTVAIKTFTLHLFTAPSQG